MESLSKLKESFMKCYEENDRRSGVYFYIYEEWYFWKSLHPGEREFAKYACLVKKGKIIDFVIWD